MISLSWNAFITLFYIFAAVYGFVLPRSRIAVILVSTYVALAVTSVWSEHLYRFILEKNNVFGQLASNASMFTVSSGLFILFIILVSVRGGLDAEEERGGFYTPFFMAVLGFFAAGLILSTIFSFMPEEIRTNLVNSSRMAALTWRFYLLWIVLPPVLLVFTSVFRRPRL